MDLKELQKQMAEALQQEQAAIEKELQATFPDYKVKAAINTDFSKIQVTMVQDIDFYQELTFIREQSEKGVNQLFSPVGFKLNPDNFIGIVIQPLLVPFGAIQFVFDLLDKIYILKTAKDEETKAVEEVK